MKKILAFVIKNNKLLLLLGSDNDPQFHESFWYVVTGAVEDLDKSMEDAVKREVKEETNLDVLDIINLNWKFEYESIGKLCVEYAFIAFVQEGEILLNEESIDYKWCDLDEFIQKIKWYDDKDILKQRLQNYLR